MVSSSPTFAEFLDAIRAGNLAEAQRMVGSSLSLFHVDSDLSIGGRTGFVEVVRGVLQDNSTDRVDDGLYYAAFNDELEIVDWFLDHGAQINTFEDGENKSPALESAVRRQNLEAVKHLVERGAIVSSDFLDFARGDVADYLRTQPLKSRADEFAKVRVVSAAKLPGEMRHLASVVDDPNNQAKKLAYADWLDSENDARGKFYRQFVEAWFQKPSKQGLLGKVMGKKPRMDETKFPRSDGMPQDWLRMIGFHIVQKMVEQEYAEPQESILAVTRPAIQFITTRTTDDHVPVGMSKLGGLPDMPPDTPWPRCNDCTNFCYEPIQSEDWCGFVGQFNCADLAKTLAGRRLPKAGLISIFLYARDDLGGLRIFYFPEVGPLQRSVQPGEFTEGNDIRETQSLLLTETLDLPAAGSPWGKELELDADQLNYLGDKSYSLLLPGADMLGYCPPTSGEDPTRFGKATEHLLSTELNGWMTIHIQLKAKDLAKGNFDAAELVWIDCG